MVNAVACIVDDEQTVRAVVIANEIGDMAIQLMLRLNADVEFDDFGLVVEAFAEEFFEFVGL
jgi:hypothetical protein